MKNRADSLQNNRKKLTEIIENKQQTEKDGKVAARRGFFFYMAVGGASVASVIGLGKFADTVIPENIAQEAYRKDVLVGDRVLAEKEYVLMTEQEKQELVRMFVDNYKKETTADS